jgi:hypothetical protein
MKSPSGAPTEADARTARHHPPRGNCRTKRAGPASWCAGPGSATALNPMGKVARCRTSVGVLAGTVKASARATVNINCPAGPGERLKGFDPPLPYMLVQRFGDLVGIEIFWLKAMCLLISNGIISREIWP